MNVHESRKPIACAIPAGVTDPLEQLLSGAEKVVLRGWSTGAGREWVVDIVTVGSDGHGCSGSLEAALREAISEL